MKIRNQQTNNAQPIYIQVISILSGATCLIVIPCLDIPKHYSNIQQPANSICARNRNSPSKWHLECCLQTGLCDRGVTHFDRKVTRLTIISPSQGVNTTSPLHCYSNQDIPALSVIAYCWSQPCRIGKLWIESNYVFNAIFGKSWPPETDIMQESQKHP